MEWEVFEGDKLPVTGSIQEKAGWPLDGVVAEKIQTSEGEWDGDVRPDDL